MKKVIVTRVFICNYRKNYERTTGAQRGVKLKLLITFSNLLVWQNWEYIANWRYKGESFVKWHPTRGQRRSIKSRCNIISD